MKRQWEVNEKAGSDRCVERRIVQQHVRPQPATRHADGPELKVRLAVLLQHHQLPHKLRQLDRACQPMRLNFVGRLKH